MKRRFWLIGAVTGLMIGIAGIPGAAEEVVLETTEAAGEPGELLHTADDLFYGETDTEAVPAETDVTENMLFLEEADDQVYFTENLADSAAIVESGYCGWEAEWTLDDQGVLTISGTGEINKKASDYVRDRTQIKKVVINEGITSIGESAFAYCYDLADISLPNSITGIGSWAFQCCSSLTSISIPANVSSLGWDPFGECYSLAEINVSAESTVYSSEDGVLFDKSRTRLIKCPEAKTSVILPDSVIYIEDSAFSNCSHLSDIIIPESVSSIGQGAFYSCGSLKSITIPAGITCLEAGTFNECSSLRSIDIPDTLDSIEGNVFEGCGSLTSITIPEGVTHIGGYAFFGCFSLKSLTIPDSVVSIGEWAFTDCSSLTSITIPASVTRIGDNAFGWFDAYEASDRIIYGYSDSFAHAYAVENNITFVALDAVTPEASETMHRLYNPYTEEHLYTGSEAERDTLVGAGWQYDGVAWNAPVDSNIKVYRLYNPYGDFHFYSSSEEEIANLETYGWIREGVAWCSDEVQGTPIYRLFNPYVQTNYHMFTTGIAERDLLVSAGWQFEGVAFYGVK